VKIREDSNFSVNFHCMTAADTARLFGLRRSNVIAQPIKKPDEIGSQHPSCFPENDDQSLCRESVEEFCSELEEQYQRSAGIQNLSDRLRAQLSYPPIG
jgi:hypothetical protein